MSAPVTLGDLAAAVAAPGTDPDALARLVAFAAGPGGGPERLRRRLVDAPAAPADATDAAALLAGVVGAPAGPDAAGRRADAAAALRRWTGLGVRVAVVGDPAYPARLAEGWPHVDAPLLLAWRGTPPGDAGPGVAVVGTRRATAYGLEVAAELAAAVARAGGRVVSGGARGVDAAAHAAALGLPGGTTVVLGCGHAVAYPRDHARDGGLFARVLDDGGTLVSELLPDVAPHPGVIRARNRIVAALAETVGSDPPAAGALAAALRHLVPPAAAAVLARAWPRPLTPAEVARAAGCDAGELMAGIVRARLAGALEAVGDGVRVAAPAGGR